MSKDVRRSRCDEWEREEMSCGHRDEYFVSLNYCGSDKWQL